MIVRLVSTVEVDVRAFPLHLSLPDGINNGGFMPGIGTSFYSQIDLLTAGLEAQRLDLKVTDLSKFFDMHRNMHSDHLVRLTLQKDKKLVHLSVAEIKSDIVQEHDHGYLSVMRHNAPLTFKWVEL